mgnify:CR=1 FL=1|tara:strand:+ start:169 stop:492 length:324 start_codon:yes stop_codon:yes gene_type:complete
MKNLILKWLGLDGVLAQIDILEDRIEGDIKTEVQHQIDDVKYDIQSDIKYELEDEFLSEDDAISKFEEVLEDNNLLDVADKMQRVDDRMTELVAGYKLEVQLIKEDF